MTLPDSTYLRAAAANGEIERNIIIKLNAAIIKRDALWADFYGALDTATVPQLVDKSRMWERADIAVKKLEKTLAELEVQHEWVATTEQLLEMGYKP